jgi:hypothetical protein
MAAGYKTLRRFGAPAPIRGLFELFAVALLLGPSTSHAANYIAEYPGGGYGTFGGNYLSNYGSGGFSGGNKLTNYPTGGYYPGGGYTVVNYGYSSGATSPDTPHRGTWAQYTQLRAQYEANIEETPVCGAYYSRTTNYCNQATLRWNPLANQ